MGLKIQNCPQCGRVFAIGLRDVCPECVKEIDRQYNLCSEYLRENKGATIGELSDETGVTINQITKFIREGRISLSDLPNLGYPCDVCHTPIREGMMCDSCRKRLSSNLKGLNEDERKREERLREELKKQSYQIRDDK